MHTSSALIELAARILRDGRDPDIGRSRRPCRDRLCDRGAAARAAAACRARAALSAGRPDAALRRAGRRCSRGQGHDRTARGAGRIAAAGAAASRRACGRCSPRLRPKSLPALLPVALVRPALDRMERRGYAAVRAAGIAAMAAAMDRSGARRAPICARRSDYSAAIRAPPIHWSRSASARALSARFLATVFSGPRSRVPSGLLRRHLRQRREQPEIDVHRLERARTGIDRLDMVAGDVGRAARHARWSRGGGDDRLAAPLGRGEAAGEQADRGRFHIALAAGDLAGEAQPRRGM